MANLKNSPKLKGASISADDMVEFVGLDSDFALEMRVLEQLTSLGFTCSHSGTYRDPVTNKIRQFDIRAVKESEGSRLSMAVECKNLQPDFPLLISAIPRNEAEAFHDQIRVIRSLGNQYPHVSTRQVASVYLPGEMVGKKSDQVKRDASSGALTSNDETTFDKLNQAINSCQDLVVEAANHSKLATIRVIVPMLVLPSGTLWQVDYTRNGSLQTQPRLVPRSNLFQNHSWQAATGLFGQVIPYRLSHLELVTFDALSEVVAMYFSSNGLFSSDV